MIGVIGGALAAGSGASPTGHIAVDLLLVAAAVAGVSYAAASAPWWSLTAASAAAVAFAADPILIAVGTVAYLASLVVGVRRRSLPEVRCVSAAIALNVFARSQLGGFFGLSAILALVVGAMLLVFGIRRRPRPIRRAAWRTMVACGGLAVIAVLGFLAEAGLARADLEAGRRQAQSGIAAIERGDYAGAAQHFRQASNLLDNASAHLRRPWAAAAGLVPVVAQHQSAAATLTGDGADAATQAATALAAIDPESLRVIDGRIDVAAVEALNGPATALQTALAALGDAAASSRSPWLLAPVADAIDDLSMEVADNAAVLDRTVLAVRIAPQMLGADGPRTYLVLFTTPAEARGLGGFVGNYAEMRVDDGRIEMTQFGRASELEQAAQAAGARIEGPAEFLSRYGTFGYNTDGAGLVGSASWRNITLTPNFPWVGEVAAQLYPQATGRSIDGVIAIDPYVIGTLLDYTGPLQLSTVSAILDSSNAAQYILFDQYLNADQEERIDALEEVARRTVDGLLGAALPAPTMIARDLGPYALDRRLQMWAADPIEQQLMRSTGLLGELPALGGADGWAVTVTNAGGSKIDTFLDRRFDYRSSTDPSTGLTSATLGVDLSNSAPTSGLPDYVIGNELGLPPGTSRLYVSFYSALELTSATLDGQPVSLAESTEHGWKVYSGFVELPAGATGHFQLTLRGRVADPDTVVTWVQPLARPPTIPAGPAPPG